MLEYRSESIFLSMSRTNSHYFKSIKLIKYHYLSTLPIYQHQNHLPVYLAPAATLAPWAATFLPAPLPPAARAPWPPLRIRACFNRSGNVNIQSMNLQKINDIGTLLSQKMIQHFSCYYQDRIEMFFSNQKMLAQHFSCCTC